MANSSPIQTSATATTNQTCSMARYAFALADLENILKFGFAVPTTSTQVGLAVHLGRDGRPLCGVRRRHRHDLLRKDRACAREVGTSRDPIDRVEFHGAGRI